MVQSLYRLFLDFCVSWQFLWLVKSCQSNCRICHAILSLLLFCLLLVFQIIFSRCFLSIVDVIILKSVFLLALCLWILSFSLNFSIQPCEVLVIHFPLVLPKRNHLHYVCVRFFLACKSFSNFIKDSIAFVMSRTAMYSPLLISSESPRPTSAYEGFADLAIFIFFVSSAEGSVSSVRICPNKTPWTFFRQFIILPLLSLGV